MEEIANEILFEMRIKERKVGNQKKFVMTKDELMRFLMKYNELILKIEKSEVKKK